MVDDERAPRRVRAFFEVFAPFNPLGRHRSGNEFVAQPNLVTTILNFTIRCAQLIRERGRSPSSTDLGAVSVANHASEVIEPDLKILANL